MEALIGIVIAVASGLTYLTYKHPFAYKIIGPLLMLLIGGWCVQTILWNYGTLQGSMYGLLKIAQDGSEVRISAFADSFAKDYARFQEIDRAFMILLGTETYLGFLFWLPMLIAHDKKEQANLAELSGAVRDLQDIVKQYKPVEPTKNQDDKEP